MPVTRVAVLGGAGAGKSTFARALSQTLALPVVHLDRLVYGPHWVRHEEAEVRARVSEALAGERWAVEGTYPALLDLILPCAELVVWIEQPTWRRLYRTWRKTRRHRDGPRADRPDECEEQFGWFYVRTILSFGELAASNERRLRAATPGRVVRLRGDRAVAQFLKDVR